MKDSEKIEKIVTQLEKDNLNLKKLYQRQLMMISKMERDNRKLKRENKDLTLKVTTLTKQQKEHNI